MAPLNLTARYKNICVLELTVYLFILATTSGGCFGQLQHCVGKHSTGLKAFRSETDFLGGELSPANSKLQLPYLLTTGKGPLKPILMYRSQFHRLRTPKRPLFRWSCIHKSPSRLFRCKVARSLFVLPLTVGRWFTAPQAREETDDRGLNYARAWRSPMQTNQAMLRATIHRVWWPLKFLGRNVVNSVPL